MKPHGFLVYLPPELYVAVVKLQADKGLGRVYPVLYAINEGLFKLGYIEREIYDVYKHRYSEPLVKKVSKPLTLEELKEQEKLKRLQKHFSAVLKQWPTLREKTRQSHIVKAKQYEHKIPNAKLVSALASGNSKQVEKEVEL